MHHLAREHNMVKEKEFWRRLSLGILRHCDALWVLRLDGWDESIMLTEEMDFATDFRIVTRHFDGDNFQEVV